MKLVTNGCSQTSITITQIFNQQNQFMFSSKAILICHTTLFTSFLTLKEIKII